MCETSLIVNANILHVLENEQKSPHVEYLTLNLDSLFRI